MNASRKPSPHRLNASTTKRIVKPGINVSQGASNKKFFPSERILNPSTDECECVLGTFENTDLEC